MTRGNILVIEDEADISEVIAYNLRREGFTANIVERGDQAIEAVREQTPDLILLDLMLPGMDGLDICRALKADDETQSIPVIMVTAKGEESDIVIGLELGADDYLTKPFSPRELVARTKTVLRRVVQKDTADNSRCITRDGVVIDPTRHQVTLDGEVAVFTATEFRLLQFMASHPGRVFTRDHLVSRAMGEDAIIVDRNIDVHIRAIRKKLESYRDLIETVRGVGYRFKELNHD